MSVVVDASLLVAATTDSGPEGVWAEKILSQGGVIAPHLVLVEATNILRRLERSREVTALEAATARRDLVRLAIDLLPFEPFADRVWELRRNVTSYDAWYVAIAEAFDLPLATLDRRLARTTGPACRFLTPGRAAGRP
jgi:predicted nucleic acid-binding protein